MRRVPEVPEVHYPDEHADDGNDFREHVAKVIELALQGGLLADLRRDGLVNVTNGRLLTREYDDS